MKMVFKAYLFNGILAILLWAADSAKAFSYVKDDVPDNMKNVIKETFEIDEDAYNLLTIQQLQPLVDNVVQTALTEGDSLHSICDLYNKCGTCQDDEAKKNKCGWYVISIDNIEVDGKCLANYEAQSYQDIKLSWGKFSLKQGRNDCTKQESKDRGIMWALTTKTQCEKRAGNHFCGFDKTDAIPRICVFKSTNQQAHCYKELATLGGKINSNLSILHELINVSAEDKACPPKLNQRTGYCVAKKAASKLNLEPPTVEKYLYEYTKSTTVAGLVGSKKKVDHKAFNITSKEDLKKNVEDSIKQNKSATVVDDTADAGDSDADDTTDIDAVDRAETVADSGDTLNTAETGAANNRRMDEGDESSTDDDDDDDDEDDDDDDDEDDEDSNVIKYKDDINWWFRMWYYVACFPRAVFKYC